jgi:hypothetical protein
MDKMKESAILYLVILIFFSVFTNLFQGLENFLITLTYPFDIAFSQLHAKIESRNFNEESLNNILDNLDKKPIFIVESKNIDNINLKIPYGIILTETNRNFTVLSNENGIKKDWLVVSEDGTLLGFVENSYSNKIIVKKLGWGNQEFFGKTGNVDVLVKEYNGNLLVELPEDFHLTDSFLEIDFPFYVKTFEDNNTIITGEIVSKFGDFYLFNTIKNENSLVYFLPF